MRHRPSLARANIDGTECRIGRPGFFVTDLRRSVVILQVWGPTVLKGLGRRGHHG